MMRGIGSVKAVKGAFYGLSLTGGWLIADLLLPEPWGDYLLFGALAVVNAMAGWYIGQLTDKQDKTSNEIPSIDARVPVPSESE